MIRSRSLSPSSSSTTQLYGLFDFLSPYESKIPPELKEDIYRAEANTSAAKDRTTRIIVYVVIALIGISSGIFNGVLTDIRMNGIDGKGIVETTTTAASSSTQQGGSLGVDVLVDAGFGWVLSNPAFKFLFTNKIGGALCVLVGGAGGLLAEAELDTKRLNAEKIYEELERRREQKQKKKTKKKNKKNVQNIQGSSSKKRRSGKEMKRLGALSEVLSVESDDVLSKPNESEVSKSAVGIPVNPESDIESIQQQKDSEPITAESQGGGGGGGGLLDQMKSMYEKADTMAASQALLLNKKLEEAGVVEKITDETGLKVIGKDEAQKIAQAQAPKQEDK